MGVVGSRRRRQGHTGGGRPDEGVDGAAETMAFRASMNRVCGSNEMFPEITRRLKGCRKALGGIHVNVIDRQRSVVGPRTA